MILGFKPAPILRASTLLKSKIIETSRPASNFICSLRKETQKLLRITTKLKIQLLVTRFKLRQISQTNRRDLTYKFKVMIPQHFEYKQKVVENFNCEDFIFFIGARLKTIRPGFCEIHLPFKIEFSQLQFLFNAGIISTIAENASRYSACSMMAKTSAASTVDFKINMLSTWSRGRLIVRSKALKTGGMLTTCTSKVYSVTRGVEELCATSQSTVMEVKN